MNKAETDARPSASPLITQKFETLGDWRALTLGRLRELIRQALPEVIEEMKWGDTPVWSQDGILCTGESYKKIVKLTFARGASLPDPCKLFNASLDGKVRRAIDIGENQVIDAQAFSALIRQAASLNAASKQKKTSKNKAAREPVQG